jgi:uncharacterized protein (DUF58 family)
MISQTLHPPPIRAACAPLGRWSFGLTPRSIGLLIVGFFFLIPGFWDERLSYSMLAWDALVLLAASIDGLRLPAPEKLIASREWSNTPALDSETELELTIENQSALPLDCRLADELPLALRDDREPPRSVRLTSFPHVSVSVRGHVRPRERGDSAVGYLFVRYQSPLGLVERWAKAPLNQTVRVYPAFIRGEEQQIYLARSRQIESQLRQARQRGLGRDFESLREYREGDDLRDICWTASARRGSLITRQYQVERSQAVWIVLDCGRLMRSRVMNVSPSQAAQSTHPPVVDGLYPPDHAKLDYACSAAIALAQLAQYSGDRVGLLAYGQRVQQRLLPGRGSAHLRQMIELLAQARAESGEADHWRATALLGRLQPRRSLILWITDLAETAMRPEVIEAASTLLHRHVLLFVAMAQPEIESIAEGRPRNIDEMFRAAAAQEMAARRELLLANLKEQGALTLDLHPRLVTASVLNQYLAVKERAMV